MNKLLILLLLTTSFASCQEKYSDYKVIQVEGNEKQNSQVVKEVSINENGQIQFEKYSGFKTSKYNSFVDVEITNFYKDTLLIETLKYYPNSIDADSARIEYTYNDKNQLIRRKHFDFKKRLKKTLEFGDCLIDSTHYEQYPTWKLISNISFRYDKKGQKVEYYAPEIHWDSQNHYFYEYDHKGNLVKETSLEDDELIWEKHYRFVTNGYDFFYNRDPETTIKNKSDWPYYYEVRFKKDSQGNVIEESKTRKDGTLDCRIEKEYQDNRIVKEKSFNRNNELELTKIYKYE